MRRSVAHNYTSNICSCVDPFIIDVMLYNIEIAQTFSSGTYHKTRVVFYKSMFNSFEQAVIFMSKWPFE
jgi:hypothetical protein